MGYRSGIIALLAAAATMLSCGKEDKQGGSKSTLETKDVRLKVMSFNIRHTGESSDTGDKAWQARKEAVAEMFRDETPDIVGLQEATTEQVTYLTEQLPDYAFIAPGNNKCIMYRKDRFTKVKNGHFWLSDTPSKQSVGWDASGARLTAWVQLRETKSNQIIYFFDTHLDVNGVKARINGAALIVDQMKIICGSTTAQIVLGDMNTSDDACLSKYAEYLENARDTSPVTDRSGTFNGFSTLASQSIIDHIYYRNVVPEKYVTLPAGGYGKPFLSDHNAITFEFTIRK